MKEIETLIGCKQSNQGATKSWLDKSLSGAGALSDKDHGVATICFINPVSSNCFRKGDLRFS